MLTIQPNVLSNSRPVFKASEEYDDFDEINLAKMDSDKYEQMKNELEEQRDNFTKMVNDEDLELPKPVNKVIKGAAVGTSAILSGMAAGWGTKKSFEGFERLMKTDAIKGLKAKISNDKLAMAKKTKSLKEKFVNSSFYKKIKKTISENYTKFGNTKFGKPIVNFLNSTGKFIKKAYNKVANGVRYLIGKIKGVKKSTYVNTTVNTVGVSGGVASGVNALREKDGVEE